MNLIWDIVLQAKKDGISRQDLKFKQAEVCSPYLEQAFPCLNQENLESAAIEVNCLFRFSSIFKEALHPDFQDNSDCFDSLTDILLHYLAETDLRHGLSRREYYIYKIMDEIRTGHLGEKVQKAYGTLNAETQYEMAGLFLSQMQTGSSLMLYRKVLIRAFSDAIVYQRKRDKSQIIVYISDPKTEALKNKMDFINSAFLPVRFHVRVFWEHHFEIIGVDAAMILEETVIF